MHMIAGSSMMLINIAISLTWYIITELIKCLIKVSDVSNIVTLSLASRNKMFEVSFCILLHLSICKDEQTHNTGVLISP
jgi:hypothetical protein